MSQGLEASDSLAQGTKKESARAEDAGKESGGQVQKEGKGLPGEGSTPTAQWRRRRTSGPSRLSLTWTITRRFPMRTSPQTPR